MFIKIRIQMISKAVLFALFALFIPYFFLESSLINPDLAPELPGYEDFTRGRQFFNESDWDKSIHFFSQALQKSEAPWIKCSNYPDEDGYGSICDDFNEDIRGYIVQEGIYEIYFAIYRHSHFYLGLIHLNKGEFKKANRHFKKAIGFNGIEEELGIQFYKCANIIKPSWIALTSVTSLHVGNIEEAKLLIDKGLWTLDNFDILLSYDWWRDITIHYWSDLKSRGLTNEKWQETQAINLFNTGSLIACAQRDIGEAIYLASEAINHKEYAIKTQIFPEDSEDNYVLYYNRGLFYSLKQLYKEALNDFTKAIVLNPGDAEIYFHRGGIYLILDDYAKALNDFHQAISLNPSNSEYYHQIALCYLIMGSINDAKLNIELAVIQKNKLKAYQNEVGIFEFSKGSLKKAFDHFTQFIQLNPDLSHGYRNRGATLYYGGMWEEAIQDYDEAINIDPTQTDLYQMKATALMSFPLINKEETNAHLLEAENNLQTAMKLNPNKCKNLSKSCCLLFLKR